MVLTHTPAVKSNVSLPETRWRPELRVQRRSTARRCQWWTEPTNRHRTVLQTRAADDDISAVNRNTSSTTSYY